jgi:hypothetical protein
MTRALPFTKANLRRRITAAREEGLRVTGIKPDGTLITAEAVDKDAAEVVNFLEQENKVRI